MKQKTELTEKEVMHVAQLANLTLSRQEVVKFQKQLTEILNYTKILEEVETRSVEPTSQIISSVNITRPDMAEKSLSQKEALSGVKETSRGLFKIKRILDNDS